MNRVIEFHNTENSKAVEFYNKRRQIYFNFNKYNKKKLNKNGTTLYVCAANQECKVSLTLGINNIITRLPDETAHFEHLPQTYVEIDIEIKLARLVDEVQQNGLCYAQIESKYHKIYNELIVQLVYLSFFL